MSVGRWILRGWAFQGRIYATWALGNGGVVPATRFARFAAGDLYQSQITQGHTYQSAAIAAGVYQSGVLQGQTR
jgi:hypothetical protein